MSGQPVSTASHPPHGHPDNLNSSTQSADKPSTASHPPPTKPDPTITLGASAVTSTDHHSSNSVPNNAQGRLTAAHPSSAAKLASLKVKIKAGLRQYPDFPSPGVLFEDILPIFADPGLHEALITALELCVLTGYGQQSPDVIVGLEARGFLFGPSLALRLGAGFVPLRKKGKLPGKIETASFNKEYGEDHLQVQSDMFKRGQRVLVVDDVIATGTNATADLDDIWE